MTTTIAFCNPKGGVSKTTTTSAFAAALSQKGYTVLCVDLDSQSGNLSLSLRADKSAGQLSAGQLFEDKPGSRPIHDYIQTTEICDLIAGNEVLIRAERTLANELSRELWLSKWLSEVNGLYDYILIDTQGVSLNLFTLNAIAAADQVIMPTCADYYATVGMIKLIEDMTDIRDAINQNLTITGIVVTQYRGNTNEQKSFNEALVELSKMYQAPLFDTHIRQSVVVQEAQRAGADVLSYDPTAPVIKDYEDLVDEYLAKYPQGKGGEQ